MALLIEHPERLHTEAVNSNAQLCRDFFDDVWVRGNVDHMEHYLAPGFTWNAAPGYAPDLGGYRQYVHDAHASFPDFQGDLEKVVADGHGAAVHWCVEGTHNGPMFGLPATGHHIRLEGLTLDMIEDGRIVKELVFQDTAAMMMQMGATDLSALMPS